MASLETDQWPVRCEYTILDSHGLNQVSTKLKMQAQQYPLHFRMMSPEELFGPPCKIS